MIKLTQKSGKAVYINPDHLVDVGMLKEGMTYVTTTISGDGVYEVSEFPEEVARKVLEYRLAISEYRALSEKLDASDCDKRLWRLAGLEESQ